MKTKFNRTCGVISLTIYAATGGAVLSFVCGASWTIALICGIVGGILGLWAGCRDAASEAKREAEITQIYTYVIVSQAGYWGKPLFHDLLEFLQASKNLPDAVSVTVYGHSSTVCIQTTERAAGQLKLGLASIFGR